jgi:hypothetical protein
MYFIAYVVRDVLITEVTLSEFGEIVTGTVVPENGSSGFIAPRRI